AKAERKKERPDDIDPALWGQAIAKLKPIRIRNDRANLAIVLSEKNGAEEGIYVSLPISSYVPRVGDRFTMLERLSANNDGPLGLLFHYKMTNAKSHHLTLPEQRRSRRLVVCGEVGCLEAFLTGGERLHAGGYQAGGQERPLDGIWSVADREHLFRLRH